MRRWRQALWQDFMSVDGVNRLFALSSHILALQGLAHHHRTCDDTIFCITPGLFQTRHCASETVVRFLNK